MMFIKQNRFSIEHFHSRDQQPHWFNQTIESICIKIDPKGLAWYTNMPTVTLFWYTNMVAVTTCENTLFYFLVSFSFSNCYFSLQRKWRSRWEIGTFIKIVMTYWEAQITKETESGFLVPPSC